MGKQKIFFVGLAGSGKTYISSVFEKFGIPVIPVGPQIKKYLSLGPADYGLIEEKTEADPYFVSKALLESTEGLESTIIFEGIKSLNDLYCFGSTYQIFSVVSPRVRRFERVIKRARYKDVTDMEGLINRDKREISYGVGDLILSGDVRLENCWSDELIHLIRLEQLVKMFDPHLANTINQYIKEHNLIAKIESAKEEMKENEEKAKGEGYWLHELNI